MTETQPAIRSCLVVGSGLIGTSIALALRRTGVVVHLTDRDPVAAQRAAELGAGSVGLPAEAVDIAVVAVSPSATGQVVRGLLESGAAGTVIDTAGVKGRVLDEVAGGGAVPGRFVGSHPMAGRERSGPGAAQADLFEGRPWVLVDGHAEPDAQARAAALVRQCGGVAVHMSADEHDVAVALVSHVPHLAASLVAARLAAGSADALVLTGQGVRDVTRVAASDPALWVDILAGNADPVHNVLVDLRADLDAVIAALRGWTGDQAGGAAALRDVLARGNQGRARLPGKHGAPPMSYVVVPVVMADRPGELARLFHDAGAADVNVEDVRIEHSPGQPLGLVELSVQPGVEQRLAAALLALGWVIHL